MQKIVSNGARTTGRFALDGDECEVIFSSPYLCFEVKNEGTADVVVSIESGKTAADSGVIIVAPQTSATLAHMRSDVHKVYVTGSGNVQVVGKNEIESVFKLAALGDSSGGGGAENVIDDTQMLSDKTYSSNKIEELLESVGCSLLTKTQEVTSDNVADPVLTDINIAENSTKTDNGFQLLAIQYTNIPERSLYLITNIIGSLYWQPISVESTNISLSKGSNASRLTVTGNTGGSFKVSVYDINLP